MVEEYQVISSGNEEIYDAIKIYIENSKLIKREVKGNKGELFFLEEGKIFFTPAKNMVEVDNISDEIFKNLEKIIRRTNENARKNIA